MSVLSKSGACLACPVVKLVLAVILGWGLSSCIPGSGVGVDQTRPVARSALRVRLSRGRFLHRAFELGVGSEEVPLLFGAGPFQSRSFHGGAVTFNRAVRRYTCPCDSVSLPFLVLLCSTAYLQARPCFCALPSRNRTVAQALKPPWALRSLRTMEGRLPQALSSVLTSLGRTRRLSPKLDRRLLPKCVPGRNQQNA